MSVHIELTEAEWSGLVSWLNGFEYYVPLLHRVVADMPEAKAVIDAQRKLPEEVLSTLKAMGGSADVEMLVATVRESLPLKRTAENRDLRRQNIWQAIDRSLVPKGYVTVDTDGVISVCGNVAP